MLSECDGVLVAGGGNLNSRYGWLLYERAAVVAVARALGKPVVISGQTLGPQLTAPDAAELARMLESAAMSSMREPASLQLARSLGATAVAGLDDASFLEPGEISGAELGSGIDALPDSGYVAVTVAPTSADTGDFPARLGAELDALHERTGLPAVFIPHMGVGSDRGWDLESHTRIADSMSTPLQQLPVLPARQVAALTAGASLVVTSRYHPAVFALSAGVPVVGLATDTYSGVRIAGAMGNWGMADFALPCPRCRRTCWARHSRRPGSAAATFRAISRRHCRPGQRGANPGGTPRPPSCRGIRRSVDPRVHLAPTCPQCRGLRHTAPGWQQRREARQRSIRVPAWRHRKASKRTGSAPTPGSRRANMRSCRPNTGG
ncbi:polysaccharide pyruvyl transferase family protein [Arthrobacter sp. ATA002]|nr:polysaccharide pyruvyl transferase family protein [Arthrobacter sp. ATA002]